MDSPTIRQLRSEWRALASSGAARTACTRLAAHEPVIAHLDVQDLAELVSAPVSYTHLDVYKRQAYDPPGLRLTAMGRRGLDRGSCQ